MKHQQLFFQNEEIFQHPQEVRMLGKAPARPGMKSLVLSDYLKADIKIPTASKFWTKKSKFPLKTFGNNQYGDCTRASQALLAMRMERIECKRTPEISDQEVIDVYLKMTARLYGGGDTGAYEEDALSDWRKEDLTFHDTKGRPLTIDAFTSVNYRNVDEMKKAIFLSGAHGIKVCFNLPTAWSSTYDWDLPAGQDMIGDYAPGSWGGHSMTAVDYDAKGMFLAHSWGVPDGHVSWEGVLAYCDEAHMVIDSVDKWKKRVGKLINIPKLTSDVNSVSPQKIK